VTGRERPNKQRGHMEINNECSARQKTLMDHFNYLILYIVRNTYYIQNLPQCETAKRIEMLWKDIAIMIQ
jgi:hypothetical protein